MSKKIDVLSLKGEKVKDIKLEDNIFNIEPNDAVVKDAIVAAMAGARQGTASVKTRAEVSGGGRKPYRQKEELVMQDKEVLEHHIIDMVVLCLDQYQEIIQRK